MLAVWCGDYQLGDITKNMILLIMMGVRNSMKHKYEMGQLVLCVIDEATREWENCAACGGTGTVVIGSTDERQCPDCYSKGGRDIIIEHKFVVSKIMRIGRITCEQTGILSTVKYMCVGSGTIWRECDLYGSFDEANEAIKMQAARI